MQCPPYAKALVRVMLSNGLVLHSGEHEFRNYGTTEEGHYDLIDRIPILGITPNTEIFVEYVFSGRTIRYGPIVANGGVFTVNGSHAHQQCHGNVTLPVVEDSQR